MTRDEMVVKMTRYYNFKNVMVEENYMTPLEFCSKMLELIEELGMLPPDTMRGFKTVNRWDVK